MKIRSAITLAAFVVAGVGSPAVYAAPAGVHAPVYAMFAKDKMVKFSLRNDSGVQVQLKVGEQMMSLEAGKTLALKLPIGTRIVTTTATPNHAAGELVAEASTILDNNTLAFK